MPTTVNTQFERSFATLAYAFVQEKAQKLMPYMIGFQVIQKNDDDTRAAGAFGFKIGDQWMYAPMFFINGDLKGYDLLYVKTPDLFIPCQENWINFILSHDPKTLGEGEAKTPRELGVLPPDFRAYYRSPLQPGMKSADFNVDWAPGTEGWLVGQTVKGAGFHSEDFDVSPLVDALTRDPKNAELDAACDLRNLVKDSMLAKAAARLIVWRPSMADALGKFYDGSELVPPDLTKKAAPVADTELQALGLDRPIFNYYVRDLATRGAISDQSDVGRRVQKLLLQKGLETPAELRANLPALTLVPDEVRHEVPVPEKAEDQPVELLDVATPRDDLSEKEAEALMIDGYAIRDLRKTASVAFEETVLHEHVFSPTETGCYSVLGGDGEWHGAFVCVNPRVPGRTERMAGYSLVAVGARAVVVKSGLVLASRKLDDKDVKLESVALSSVPVPSCSCDGVFSACSNDKPEDYAAPRAFYMVSPDRSDATAVMFPKEKRDNGMLVNPHIPRMAYPRNATEAPFEMSSDWVTGGDGSNAKAIILGPRVQAAYGSVVLPETWKAVRVHAYPEFELGRLDQAAYTLMKRADLQPVTVSKDGGGFVIQSGEKAGRYGNEKEAVWHLVSAHGLTADAAVLGVRQAEKKGCTRILVKHAAPYMAPSMHELDNVSTYDETYGYPIMEHQQAAQPVDGLQDTYATDDTYARVPQDQRTMAAAEQAAQSGEKEVMDVGVLASLVKAVDVNRFSDKYLKDLTRGLDRVGRLLFLYYWHYDKFADRYGKDEMEELESALQNTFKAVGDTVLFLKKKTVDPDRMLQGSDASLDNVAGTGNGV